MRIMLQQNEEVQSGSITSDLPRAVGAEFVANYMQTDLNEE